MGASGTGVLCARLREPMSEKKTTTQTCYSCKPGVCLRCPWCESWLMLDLEQVLLSSNWEKYPENDKSRLLDIRCVQCSVVLWQYSSVRSVILDALHRNPVGASLVSHLRGLGNAMFKHRILDVHYPGLLSEGDLAEMKPDDSIWSPRTRAIAIAYRIGLIRIADETAFVVAELSDIGQFKCSSSGQFSYVPQFSESVRVRRMNVRAVTERDFTKWLIMYCSFDPLKPS